MKLNIFIDGGSRGNPGRGACAAVLFDAKGALLKEEGKYLGHCTNNFAEYNGLMLALSAAALLGAAELKVFSDSELLVKQFNGEYRIKDPALKELMAEIRKRAAGFKKVTLSHVSRAKNEHADLLINEILDAAKDAPLHIKKEGAGKPGQVPYQPELF